MPLGLDTCRALCAYEGVGRVLVGALKYDGHAALAGVLGEALAALVPKVPHARTATHEVTVTWAPTSAENRRHRGYDQAELLARSTARALGVPLRSLVQRGPGPGQTGRPAHERVHGPRFAARPGTRGTVVLVDDVRTTGATLAAAAAALHAAGAAVVHGLVVAATPPGRHAA